jgi:hypothetical protein
MFLRTRRLMVLRNIPGILPSEFVFLKTTEKEGWVPSGYPEG